MEIISKSNETVKYIKSLNDKKFRQKYNAFYIEGVKVISELLDIKEEKAIDVEFIAYSYDILMNTNGSENLIKKIEKKGIKIIEISKDIFNYLTDTVNSQGILAVVKKNKIDFKNLDFNSNILILDKLQDSGNLGTIIRTANAFGITNIICSKGTTDVYSPKVVRSTMLGILKSNIIYSDNICETIQDLKEKDYLIIATALYNSENLNSNLFNNKCAIVIGNEANGVSEEVLEVSDKKVKIPIKENVESLNAACAASIILYEQYMKK